jgi:hypothetical protein
MGCSLVCEASHTFLLCLIFARKEGSGTSKSGCDASLTGR